MEKLEVQQIEEEWDYGGRLGIEINGEEVFSIGSGEPEDMILGRDLRDAYNVLGIMRQMYEAGRDGREVEFLPPITKEDD